MHMKRFLILLMMASLAFLFVAGCGKGTEEGKLEKAAEKAPEKAMQTAVAQELSATLLSTSGGQTLSSKMYMKPDKFRTDNEAAGSSTIVRKDLNKVWMIMTAQKTYMEMPGVTDEQIQMAEEKVKGEVSRKEVGSETVDGHPAIKYEVTASVDDKTVQTYQWWATDINFPVKTAAIDGSWVMEYRDIRIGGQPDSLFEVPAGYKKMTIPGLPEGMKGKIPGMDAK